jgi:NAD+ kinase
MILLDPNNPRAKEIYSSLCEHADLSDLPLSPVIGGDGWMLNCIRTHGTEHIYLGLNAGHLGFLMNECDSIPEVASQLSTQKWTSHEFPRLLLNGRSSEGTDFEAKAVNDIYVARTSGQSANLRIEIDGVAAVDRLVCDGVVVATSLGSTGYNCSAGGTPCHPLLPGIHITPISPHTPRLRSLIVPPSSVIRIEALVPERRPLQAVSDGFSHGEACLAEIRLADSVQLAFLERHNFTETLVRKILR